MGPRQAGKTTLAHIKNKEQQGVDFVVANDGEPAVQLVEEAGGYRLIPNGDQSILVTPPCKWLSTLP